MDSSPQMLQVYRDDEHASVAAPLLPTINHDAETVQPRWSKRSNKNKNAVRGAIATGAFLATYLFFCAWVAFANNGSSLAQRGDSTAFPHRRFPWPFPRKRHPHHPRHHHPHPIVLGCAPIPIPSDDAQVDSFVELNVTLPRHAVVLGHHLLHGDVFVKKVNQSETEMMSEGFNKTLFVGIKVANHTWGHHPHPPPESGEENAESTPVSFHLCAVTFHGHHPHHPPPPPPPSTSLEMQEQTAMTMATAEHPHHPPHPGPHHPPFPPVIVDIFQRLNETHPKFPGYYGPPTPNGPPGSPESPEELNPVETTLSTDSVLMTAWKSTLSFLFPMLKVFPSHPHHGHPCHHKPPPPPPFIVTKLKVVLPFFTRVIYGNGPPPHRGHWRH